MAAWHSGEAIPACALTFYFFADELFFGEGFNLIVRRFAPGSQLFGADSAEGKQPRATPWELWRANNARPLGGGQASSLVSQISS
jgi:hypothetical protein